MNLPLSAMAAELLQAPPAEDKLKDMMVEIGCEQKTTQFTIVFPSPGINPDMITVCYFLLTSAYARDGVLLSHRQGQDFFNLVTTARQNWINSLNRTEDHKRICRELNLERSA